MRRHLVMLLVLVAQAAAALAAELVIDVRHTGDIGLVLTVAGEVDGRPVRWLIDTASTHHLVSRSVPSAPAQPAEELRVAHAGGVMPGRRVVLNQASMQGLSLGRLDALQVDLQPALGALAQEIDGVLGAPWFAGRRVTFDLQRRRLEVDTAPAPGGLPIELVQGLPLIALHVGDRQDRYLVDTGAAGAVIRLRQGGSGIDVWRLPLLMLDGQPRREVPIADFAGAPLARALATRAAGSVGMALLDGCRFTLDLVDQRLLVHHCTQEALRGGFGLQWSVRGGDLALVRVWPGSPAALAGLRPGDRVVGINGADAPRSLPAADALLYAAEAVDLLIERGGEAGGERSGERRGEGTGERIAARFGIKLSRGYFLPAR